MSRASAVDSRGSEGSSLSSPVGRIERLVSRMLLKHADVEEVRPLASTFRLVTLSGPELCEVRFRPGMKLQIQVGGWAYRTYTPIEWDEGAGRTRLLIQLHGTGPGTAWARALQAGQTCAFFGPRDSLDVEGRVSPALFFGDETSIGLLAATGAAPGGSKTVTVLEVDSRSATEAALSELDLADVELVERAPGDAHLGEVRRIVERRLERQPPASALLTGKASSIQTIRNYLRKQDGVSSRSLRAKAYWAPGKAGLD